MLYELAEGTPAYPMIQSAMVDGAPIGWGALSGLVGDAEKPGQLYAVNDSFYGMQPRSSRSMRRRSRPPSRRLCRSPAPVLRPRSSTSKASRSTAKAASGWPLKAIRPSSSAMASTTSMPRARSRPKSAFPAELLAARPVSASRASPPLVRRGHDALDGRSARMGR